MKFAIILPTFNRCRLLPRAIESVISQTYEDWSLYIVDDGSTDDTDAVIAPYLSDARVHYLRLNENRGKMYALNVALDHIGVDGADWFTEMDDDDRLVEDCLEFVSAEVCRYSGQGLFVFSAVRPDGIPITGMKVTGSRNYCWNRMLSKRVVRDAHEFGAVRFLADQRFHAPARSAMLRIFWGEFSLKAGAVFCDRPTKIKEYLSDGITMTRRSAAGRQRTARRLVRARYRVRVWRSVLGRHGGSILTYCVYGNLLFHLAQYRILSWLASRVREES